MEILHLVLRYAHLLGFAALTVGVLMQLKAPQKVVNKMMFYGALVQLVTGFVLVGVLEMMEADLNMTKVTVKLGLVIAIVIFVLIYRKKSLSQMVYYTLLSLIIATSLIAVFV